MASGPLFMERRNFTDKRASGYIESKTGAVFTVNYKFSPANKPSTDVSFRTFVDGTG